MNEKRKKDDNVRKEIKKLAKKEIWLSQLYRELIRKGISIPWPKFLDILDEMENSGEICLIQKGNMKFIEVPEK